jgi:hypothetical protein
MATGQSEERPGPRRGKKRQPRGEGAGLELEGKKEIRDKGKGGGRRGDASPAQGSSSEPGVSILYPPP